MNNIIEYTNVKREDISYLLGFLWADGYVYHHNHKYCVGLGIQKLDFDPYIKPILKIGNWKINYHKQIKRKEQGRARWYSKELTLYLESIGYRTKADSAEKVINTIPPHLKKYWFRGYFDGDGCVYVDKNNRDCGITICSCYEQDWQFMINFCDELKIHYDIRKNENKSGKNSHFRIRKKRDMIKFLEFIYDGFDNDNIGFIRKFEKYKLVKKSYRPPSSKYRGLSLTPSKTWCVRMCQSGKNIIVGTFKTEEKAVDEYNKSVIQFVGPNGYLNIWSGKSY